jgi:signal transduction histidine kinase
MCSGSNDRSLREELAQRERELDAIQRVMRALATETDEASLTRTALRTALTVVDADAGAVLLFDPGSRELTFRYVEGGAGDRLEDTTLGITEGIAGEVYRSGHPRISPHVAREREHATRVDRTFEYEAHDMMTAPLGEVLDQRLGVMQVLNKHAGSFDERDLRLLAILASEVTVAIEQARLYREIRDQERMALVGQMAASIVHDMKNPLTSIKGFSSELTRTDDPEERREYAEIVAQESDRILLMLQEVLDFSRGKPAALQLETMEVSDFVARLEPVLTRNLVDSGITASVCVNGEARISIDAARVERVVMNIAGNAREAMQDDPGSFTLEVGPTAGKVRIVLQDTGPGIPQEVQADLFEPFVTHGKRKGTGLGLAICRQIVEAHGGSIAVDPTSERGARFIIELPAA